MRIVLHLHGDEQDKLIVANLNQLLKGHGAIMAKLDELQAADAREDAKIDALIQAYKDQKQLVTDLQAQVAAGADPTKLQELIDAANAKAAAIDAALGVTPEVPPVNTI